MMSENIEEIDELPPIEVDSLGLNTSNISESETFVMPAADELAIERERELLCERELRALPPPPVSRSDSSSSEGEALAAAVQALRVAPHPPAPPRPAVEPLSASVLLDALLPHLPPAPFLNDYLDACHQLDDNTLAAVTDDILSHVSAILSCQQNAWSSEEVVCVGAWLCVVCVSSQTGRCAVVAARALRVLLEERAAPAHAAALSRVVSRAPPPALLPLADAASDAAHGRLANDLCDAVLAHHLDLEKEEISWSSCVEMSAAVSRRWGSLGGAARYAVVQLVGRRLASSHVAFDDVAALLRVLDRAPAPAHRHRPEHLKVSVGVSMLQLLFGAKN